MNVTPQTASVAAAADLPPPGTHLHLVGVCGMGMAPLALALKSAGWSVSGEDKHWPEEVATWLRAAGIERRETGDLPASTVLVIFSSAIAPHHPTRAAAATRAVPMMRRGLALASLVRGRRLIAVCGSHGKTTTTAMLAWALRRAGVEADYLVGGLYADNATAPAAWSGRGWVVAEIDESDGTIGHFSPAITVCVNVDWDHPDHYRERGDIERAFAALADRTRDAVFYCAGCVSSGAIFTDAARGAPGLSFGEGGAFELRSTSSAAPAPGQRLALGGRFGPGEIRTAVSAHGHFNAVNATAALAVAAHLGASDVSRLLADYPGVRRRQGVLLRRDDLTVVEDYAHHPAEIEALLRAMRTQATRRLVAVFQPHRHSRTAQFRDAFARVLALADRVWLLDVYSAGESPVPGGESIDVLAALRALPAAPEAELLADVAAAPEALAAGVQRDDLMIFVGAGDIDAVARATVARLANSALSDWRDAFLTSARLRELSPETILRRDEPLGAKTTMRVGGPAELYAEPASTADLQVLLSAARVARVPVHLLGRGSNLIIPDEGVRGLVVRLQHPHFARFLCLGPGRYWAGAGLRLKELCGTAARMGEGGFEFLEGIPGTVGGALRMNAGAMGGWMFDLVEQVHFLAPDGTLHIRTRDQMHIAYRSCAELDGAIAIGAVLLVRSREESAAIRARISAYQEKRQATQPREPSAGCVFKNPPGDSAGRIIDELGLKGLRVGGAEVSTVHGNFIINRGQATGSDVIALVRRVRDEVRERRHIELEPEVLLYGRTWKEVL